MLFLVAMQHHRKQQMIARVRSKLTLALYLLDIGEPYYALVQTMLAVLRFAEWLDLDQVEKTIRSMTIRPSSEESETSAI